MGTAHPAPAVYGYNGAMHDFQYRNGELFCEAVELKRLAARVGTPVYVYSQRTLERHVRAFREAFETVPHLIAYAVKANSNLSILRRLAHWGTGFEVVSGGELYRVLKAGGSPQKTIFSGVGKTVDEIAYAMDAGIMFFAVESRSELDLIGDVARRNGKRAPVSLRANPDIDPRTHPYISTGMRTHKFGISMPEAIGLFLSARDMPGIDLVGVGCHIGSQITEMGPFEEALAGMRSLVCELKNQGFTLKHLDFGGGLGIVYDAEEPPSPASYAQCVIRETGDLGVDLVLEPGRVIAGNAGILLTRVLLTKQQESKKFLVVDAGMNDLLRPALYGSHHQMWPVVQREGREVVDVVGPICESSDFLAQNREIAPLASGDLVAVMSAGAYGFSLSSNYNSRPRPAEVLVDGSAYRTIRRRETLEDMVRLEENPG